MSDYVVTQFWSDDLSFVEEVKKEAYKVFDAISFSTFPEKDYWTMTISELDLKESLFILDKLKDKFNINFVISYGVY